MHLESRSYFPLLFSILGTIFLEEMFDPPKAGSIEDGAGMVVTKIEHTHTHTHTHTHNDQGWGHDRDPRVQ